MASLPDKLVSQFAKMLKPDNSKKETTVYGTIVQQGTSMFVQLDGSDLLTPISSTVDVLPGERVTALIKNHSVIVNGNITSPAARTGTVTDLGNRTETLENNVSVSALINLIYPVGSLYFSASAVNPEKLFSGTKWDQIKDRFLLASGTNYDLGATGGEAEHTLTIAEMPSHSHIFGTKSASVASGTNYARLDSTFTNPSSALVESAGGSLPHNNMPPYLAVNVWKRIE